MVSPANANPRTIPAEECIVLMPVYDDWRSFHALLGSLDLALAERGLAAQVIAVNDGSETVEDLMHPIGPMRALSSIRVIHLKRNVGHQRAIALGLSYVARESPNASVLVMDADGEDRPEDAVKLVEAGRSDSQQRIIFAQRTKRSECTAFRFFYACYRVLFCVATGKRMHMGNFSFIPALRVARLVADPSLWNHYAATVVRSRLPYCLVPSERGTRLAGRSQMNFLSLFLHGLSAVAVFTDILACRALLATLAMTLLSMGLCVAATGIRVFTRIAIPGWATYAVGLGSVLFLQTISLTSFLVFLVLSDRSKALFVPVDEYESFVASSEVLYNGVESKAEVPG